MFNEREVGSAVQACPGSAATPPMHWIEIELLGEDNKGIAYELYRVRLPHGEEVMGFLDERGLARLDNIPSPGACHVCFPDLDAAAWSPLASAPPTPAR